MDVVQIVGLRRMSFTSQDGQQVEGMNFYYLMDDSHVEGKVAGKFFMSTAVLSQVGFVPKVGETVKVFYNRYGKANAFEPM